MSLELMPMSIRPEISIRNCCRRSRAHRHGQPFLATMTFSPASNTLQDARTRPLLRVLPDGKVQVIGGSDHESMEMFDPAANVFGAHAHVYPTGDQHPELLSEIKSSPTRAALSRHEDLFACEQHPTGRSHAPASARAPGRQSSGHRRQRPRIDGDVRSGGECLWSSCPCLSDRRSASGTAVGDQELTDTGSPFSP